MINNSKDLFWFTLSSNPNEEAVHLLLNHLDKVDWNQLSLNPNTDVIYTLSQHLDKINWRNLSSNSNPAAILLLEQHRERISYNRLCANSGAVHLLESFVSRELDGGMLFAWGHLDDDETYYEPWRELWANPAMIPFITKNLESTIWHIDCSSVSSNPAAIPFLEKHPDYIEWSEMSANPAAIPLLERNMDKVNWSRLSANPAAVHLLAANLDKVDWEELVQYNTNDDAIRLCKEHLGYNITRDLCMEVGFDNSSNETIAIIEDELYGYDNGKKSSVDWEGLARNPNERATQLLVQHCYPEWVPNMLCNVYLLK